MGDYRTVITVAHALSSAYEEPWIERPAARIAVKELP